MITLSLVLAYQIAKAKLLAAPTLCFIRPLWPYLDLQDSARTTLLKLFDLRRTKSASLIQQTEQPIHTCHDLVRFQVQASGVPHFTGPLLAMPQIESLLLLKQEQILDVQMAAAVSKRELNTSVWFRAKFF
ncbi:hypothetical protein [Pseudomonas sp. TSRC2-2]|uniref:hypothetical protein n=2 Tax=unclassified Pseudomonas TaxID=196821 RepID=UPI003CE95D19